MSNLSDRIDSFIEKKLSSLPKLSVPKQQLTGFQGKRQRRRPQRRSFKPGDVIGEIGTQLTPKGPYGSASDIASDVRESGELARKITGIKKPAKPSIPRVPTEGS